MDLELILAVDVSSSMSQAEQRVQRDGYVSALRHPEFARAIGSGPRGRIAVLYVEWAGPTYQRVIVPWAVLERAEQAEAFADDLAVQPIRAEAGTSISGILLRTLDLFAESPARGDRQVIDISGDGPNNVGSALGPVHDFLVGIGVTINGLAMSLARDAGPDTADSFGEHYLETYYEDCVIGGDGAFVIRVDDLAKFEAAIRHKLVLEIAGLPPRLQRASYRSRPSSGIDCMTIGQSPGR